MSPKVLLLGQPVLPSLSPAMQNAAFAALQIDCRYELRAIGGRQLPPTMAEMHDDATIIGANVTIPLKESVIPFLDELDDVAVRIGAVNTINRRRGKLVGSNTDVVGFHRALDEYGYTVAGEPVAIVGAGGAARAVAEALRNLVSHLYVVARRPQQAQRLIDHLALDHAEAIPLDRLLDTMRKVAVIVNATPVDLPAQSELSTGQRIFDLRSRRSEEGRAMLLHQGAASFHIWTGRAAPLEIMRSALQRAASAVPA